MNNRYDHDAQSNAENKYVYQITLYFHVSDLRTCNVTGADPYLKQSDSHIL